jgi:hypothetical protein
MTAEPIDLPHAEHGVIGWREGCRCTTCVNKASDKRRNTGLGAWDPLTWWAPGQQPNPGWQSQAACAGHDPEQWFPTGRTPDGLGARVVCWLCPVAADCLAAAMLEERRAGMRRYGIRGGLLAGQRGHLAAAKRRAEQRQRHRDGHG